MKCEECGWPQLPDRNAQCWRFDTKQTCRRLEQPESKPEVPRRKFDPGDVIRWPQYRD